MSAFSYLDKLVDTADKTLSVATDILTEAAEDRSVSLTEFMALVCVADNFLFSALISEEFIDYFASILSDAPCDVEIGVSFLERFLGSPLPADLEIPELSGS